MMLDVRTPPAPTGDAERDYAELSRWCDLFRRRVMIMLSNIDDENIVSVSADKIIEADVEITAAEAETHSVAAMSLLAEPEGQEGEQTE